MKRRVTDEQVKCAKNCSTEKGGCRSCALNLKECDSAGDLIRALSSDLLDAVETIRVMRNALEIVRDNTLNPAHTMTKIGLEETTDANHTLAEKILDSTKGY